MKLTTRLDGVDYPVEVPDALANNYSQAINRLEASATARTAELSALQARFDARDAQAKKLETEVSDLKDPTKLDAKIAEAAQVRMDAHSVLVESGMDAKAASDKLKGLSTAGVKKLVIEQVTPSMRLDGKDDTYVSTAYDVLMETRKPRTPAQRTRAKLPTAGNGIQAQREEARQDARDDDDEGDAAAARDRMHKRNREAWKGEPAKQ